MSGMELLEFLCIIIPVLLAAGLGFRWIAMKDSVARYKAQKDAQISAQNRKNAQMKALTRNNQAPSEDTQEMGPWVTELLEEFGIDPDVVFEEEMPQELKRLLPVAKGFIQNGGLQKILGGAMQTQQPQDNERSAI